MFSRMSNHMQKKQLHTKVYFWDIANSLFGITMGIPDHTQCHNLHFSQTWSCCRKLPWCSDTQMNLWPLTLWITDVQKNLSVLNQDSNFVIQYRTFVIQWTKTLWWSWWAHITLITFDPSKAKILTLDMPASQIFHNKAIH